MRRATLAWLIIFALLAACQPSRAAIPVEQPPPWGYADLRALDPPDAQAASQDLAAVYLRTWRSEIQIRLDLLDSSPPPDYDLYLAFDTQAGGCTNLPLRAAPEIAWDLLITIPAAGEITIVSASGQPLPTARLHVLRDTFFDTVAVHFDKALLPSRRQPFVLEVFSAPAGQATPADRVAPFRSDAAPPAALPLLIAFDEVFPAYTPAQALRLWDGAHSGPNRSRHGLHHLLSAVAQSRLPVVLLDLNTPAALSALDYVGGLATVQALARQGLLIIPPAGAPRISNSFELSTRPVDISGGATLKAAEPQATPEGPSLEIRRALLTFATSSGAARPSVLMLQASLARSAWGEPQAGLATLNYLARRPWLRALRSDELPPAQPQTSDPWLSALPPALLAALQQSPPGVITDAAWQMAAMLANPAPARSQALRAAYLAQVGHLLAAARWAAAPVRRADCTEDVDWDGQNECILASDEFFALLESDGARLTVAYLRLANGLHQLIAPTYQFTVGLSDPSEWDIATGPRADPAAIPGGFSDNLHGWESYLPASSPGQIVFSLPDGSLRKSFSLTTDGLQVSYQSDSPVLTRIPLAVDAWERFTAEWGQRYGSESIPDGWLWGLEGGTRLRIQTNGELTFHAFSDSRSVIGLPEDPNFDYGPGHYLPFPLALAEVYGREFWVKITLP